jgi:hypothetical protein
MNKVLQSIKKYGTWEETLAPEGPRFVDTKWGLKKKRNERGEHIKYKAHLNTHRFSEVPGLNFDKTFSTVVWIDTIYVLLAYAVQEGLYMAQYGIGSAHLNDTFEEGLYLKPPPSVQVTARKVLRLRKSIYVLKQVARAWADHPKAVLAKGGFWWSVVDQAHYIQPEKGEL